MNVNKDKMDEDRQILKKYSSQTMLMAITVAVIFIVFGYKSIGKGFLLASIFSVINFSLIAFLNPIILGRSRFKTGSFAFLSITIRYALLAIPLVVSLKNDSLNFYAAAAGLFTVQLIIIFNRLIINRLPSTRKV